MQACKQARPARRIPADIRCAGDYEVIAPEYIDAATLAYIAGGSGADLTLRANRAAFARYAVVPRMLREVASGSAGARLPGVELPHPVLLAPLALQCLVNPDGEVATARGAEAAQGCMVVSTLASQSLEDIAANTSGPKWFQLYFQATRADTLQLVRRAESAGYGAIVVTLDAALQLPSHGALAAGFHMPSGISPANVAVPIASPAPGENLFQAYARNAVRDDDIAWLLNVTRLPVLIKGVLHPEDAVALRTLGAAGVVVSNHGGRSLDGTPASLDMLPDVRSAVGDDYPVLFDGGIRSGADVFKAIALGADAILVGRLQVYALAVAGALGVAHLVRLLCEELELHMAASGCRSLADVRATVLRRVADDGGH